MTLPRPIPPPTTRVRIDAALLGALAGALIGLIGWLVADESRSVFVLLIAALGLGGYCALLGYAQPEKILWSEQQRLRSYQSHVSELSQNTKHWAQ